MVEFPSSHLIGKEHDRLVDGLTDEALVLSFYGNAGVIWGRGTCLDTYIKLDHRSQTDLRARMGRYNLAQSFCCWIYDE